VSAAWSNSEVELVVADYFYMLQKELTGLKYNKAECRRNLIPFLNNRSEGSVEFKHQNISAVLIKLGLPYIKGYLPRYNYQKILNEKVIDFITANPALENAYEDFVESDLDVQIKTTAFDKLITEPPKLYRVAELEIEYRRKPIKKNFLELEQKNSILGLLGEELVIQFEKWNLIRQGKQRFAEQVRWVSKDDGDGAGFDILSKQKNGADKYIEVKTTRLSKETPFFFSRNEFQFSNEHSKDFFLYRLFNFEEKAGMFIKNGSLDKICNYEPMTYKGFF
jgi:hypothetical protein